MNNPSDGVGVSPEPLSLLDTLASGAESALDFAMVARYRLSEQVDRLLGPTPIIDTPIAKDQSIKSLPTAKSLPTERISSVTSRLFTLAEEMQQQVNRLSRL